MHSFARDSRGDSFAFSGGGGWLGCTSVGLRGAGAVASVSVGVAVACHRAISMDSRLWLWQPSLTSNALGDEVISRLSCEFAHVFFFHSAMVTNRVSMVVLEFVGAFVPIGYGDQMNG